MAPREREINYDDQQKVKDPATKLSVLSKEDEWIANLDYEGFGKEVAELGKRIQKQGGQADVEHLNKIVGWRDAAALVGLATMWMGPNPLTVLALSTWTYSSWTMIAHQ